MSGIAITAAEAACGLGDSLEACLSQWRAGHSGLSTADGLRAGRLQDRSLLQGRRYAAASQAALTLARRAVARAGWTPEQTRQAWLFAASSRGNVGELLAGAPPRRRSRRFSASNSMHSEIAAAVSIDLGIRGPWQMLANGCSAGLDALGLAWMSLRSGLATRALVVAVDLPLLPELLRDFRDTRLLAAHEAYDPLSPQSGGFLPGEGVAALTLEAGTDDGLCSVEAYAANSDAYDSLIIPEDGAPLAELLQQLPRPQLICPHATGTPNHARAEPAALRQAYGGQVPPLLLLKPFTGHTLGASGLLDTALLAAALQAGEAPGNLAGLSAPAGLSLPGVPTPLDAGASILKIASGMGGHNAAVLLRRKSR